MKKECSVVPFEGFEVLQLLFTCCQENNLLSCRWPESRSHCQK